MAGRRIVVGDLHGCYDELMELLEKIGIGDDDRVICVGDLITKGPKSKEVLDLFMTDVRFSTVIGNHDLALPGYGKPEDMKARARKLLAEAGVTPQHPLRVEMVTRAIAVYVDMASFVINELKQVGIDASLKQIETAQWHAMATRGDYQIGANLTGLGVDDPDANLY